MKNWRNALLKETDTIRDAMRVIDSSSLRMGIVLNTSDKLLGTVTDGDIRRALLHDGNMHDDVNKVMNRSPICIAEGTSRASALKLLRDKDLLGAPVLGSSGDVVDFLTIQALSKLPPVDNPVFIMAGGFGTRLAPLTNNCPKPMLPVGDKPMLQILIERFESLGFRNLYVSTHYMSEIIRGHFGDGSGFGVKITYVHEENPLGTGGALGLLRGIECQLPMIMINGDVLSDLNFRFLLEEFENKKCDALMCTRELEYKIPYGVIESDCHSITGMIEKPVYRYQINSGIYVLSNALVNDVKPNECIDMPTLLKRRMDNGFFVKSYIHRGYWLDIGQMADYQRAQDDIKSLNF